MYTMLRFPEEMMLLLLRDDGRFVSVDSWAMDYAMAGGVLMDLAMENRIDTDLENLILVDDTPVGDNLLDPTLAEIAASGSNQSARFWVENTATRAADIREETLSRLMKLGILEQEEGRFMWVFRSRRYPVIDGTAEREVKLRIMGTLFSDEVPSPRDVMIIALADACGIFDHIFSRQELNRASDRIAQVSRLDLIGQAMSQAIYDIQVSVAASVHGHMV